MSGFDFTQPRGTRKPSLTPMIDVVFLLLVFFMLAARFGTDTVLTLSPPSAGVAEWVGAPRLVRVGEDGLTLNGVPVSRADLPERIRELMPSPDAPILLQPKGAADLQALIDVLEALQSAGFPDVLLVE